MTTVLEAEPILVPNAPSEVPAQALPALAANGDLISRFQGDVEGGGLVGEKKNAVTVFLCAVSAKLDKPLNLTIQGSSSAGKNHLINSVAAFLPEDMKKMISGMTPKALMHAGKHEFQHKAVFIAEYEGVAGADYAIRTMQSERSIQWEYVNSGSEGIQKKSNTVLGPAAFIQATTRSMLHPENETRLLFIQMDESPELTREINERQAREAEGLSASSKDSVKEWHKLLESLQPNGISVPFASHLVRYFPYEQVRSRRDFPKLLGLIQVSAFLHQHQREQEENVVIANGIDYAVAKLVFENSYACGPEKAIRELVRVARSFQRDFTVAELIERIGWGKTKTYDILSRAEERGYVAPAGYPRYRFVKDVTTSGLELPDELPTI
jgi:hypothetical protein